MSDKQTERLIRMHEVLERTGLKRSTLFNLMQRGLFPKSISPTGVRMSVWVESEVEHWIEEQIAGARR